MVGLGTGAASSCFEEVTACPKDSTNTQISLRITVTLLSANVKSLLVIRRVLPLVEPFQTAKTKPLLSFRAPHAISGLKSFYDACSNVSSYTTSGIDVAAMLANARYLDPAQGQASGGPPAWLILKLNHKPLNSPTKGMERVYREDLE